MCLYIRDKQPRVAKRDIVVLNTLLVNSQPPSFVEVQRHKVVPDSEEVAVTFKKLDV